MICEGWCKKTNHKVLELLIRLTRRVLKICSEAVFFLEVVDAPQKYFLE